MAHEDTIQKPPYKSFQSVLAEGFRPGTPERSGLDLYDSLRWYKANKDFLKMSLAEHLAHATPANIGNNQGLEKTQMSVPFMRKLTGLFPEAARERSVLTTVVGEPPLLFHKSSLEAGPNPTTDPSEALSPTAIIPGYTSYEEWPAAKIHLFRIPDTTVSSDIEVARLVLAEAYVHEYFHTITINLLHGDEKYLRLLDGKVIKGSDFIINIFGKLAEDHDPISHYSSSYRNGRTFKGEDKEKVTGIGEEFAETGTTHLLGFSSGSLTDISKDPFADRPEMARLMEDFLNSELLTQEDVDAAEIPIVTSEELISEYKELETKETA